MGNSQQIRWFRDFSPYINAHRGKTMVLMLPGEAFASQNFTRIIHDIALLNSLGVQLVIAFGARPQINQALAQAGIEARFQDMLRVVDAATLAVVKQSVGSLRADLEARLSMGQMNSPMHGSRIRAVSGNFVTARPAGIRQGVDLGFTGTVRRIDTLAINRQLAAGNIVILPPMGYSPTGEAFDLSYEDVADSVASALSVEKLIGFIHKTGVFDDAGNLLRELSTNQVRGLLDTLPQGSEFYRLLRAACSAVSAGVKRSHLVSYLEDGALLQELFSRDGIGTMITDQEYEQIRAATIEEVGGIISMIRPLEQAGILERRSRERLESEIERFVVDERDGMVIGCAALYPFPEDGCGELACVAVKPEYRKGGRGDRLLGYIERQARTQGIHRLFVLTTQTAHWFLERGFEPASLSDLPAKRQSLYNYQRNSRVYVKNLEFIS